MYCNCSIYWLRNEGYQGAADHLWTASRKEAISPSKNFISLSSWIVINDKRRACPYEFISNLFPAPVSTSYCTQKSFIVMSMPGFRFPCSNVGQFRSYNCMTLRGLWGGLWGTAAAGIAVAGTAATGAGAASCGLKRSMMSFPMLKLNTGAAAAAFLLFSASRRRCKTGLSFELVGSNSLWFGGLSIEAKSSPLS